MEPEVLVFLKRIAKSILLALVWLGITAAAAITGDHAFVGEHLTAANIIFYCWFVISLSALIYIYKRMWQKHL